MLCIHNKEITDVTITMRIKLLQSAQQQSKIAQSLCIIGIMHITRFIKTSVFMNSHLFSETLWTRIRSNPQTLSSNTKPKYDGKTIEDFGIDTIY